MTATTHSEFDNKTEGLEVAKAFADRIRGKTIFLTGSNPGGIGFTTAEAFASQSPARLVIVGRSIPRIQESVKILKEKYPDVDYRPLTADLASQKSVRDAAAEFLSWDDVPAVDIVVNTAGIMLLPERKLSPEGIEMHFATNHIGHFLLTSLIMPKIIKAAQENPKGDTRIINVSSRSPEMARIRWSDINFEVVNKDLPEDEQPDYDGARSWGTEDPENKAYVPIEGYSQSKVANVLFGIGLNKRLYEKHGILSLGLHPGVAQSELARSATPETQAAIQKLNDTGVFPVQTLGACASTSIVAALDPKLGPPVTKNGKENYGAFLSYCQISTTALPTSVSSSNAERLWELSEKFVGEKFSY